MIKTDYTRRHNIIPGGEKEMNWKLQSKVDQVGLHHNCGGVTHVKNGKKLV
jgi:hypothetical protein